MFNSLHMGLVCAKCREEIELQFYYGNLSRHQYRIGDAVIWGKPQRGVPTEGVVALQAAGSCGKCDDDLKYYEIYVQDGRFHSYSERAEHLIYSDDTPFLVL